MKKLTRIMLALLLAAALLLTVGCEDEPTDPVGSDSEATTEAETTLADVPAAEALDQLMEALNAAEDETQTVDNMKMDIDMSMIVSVDMDGMQNSTTLPIKIALTMAGDDMAITGNLMGTELEMIYVGGMLYMNDPTTGEFVKCSMTPEEFGSAVGTLMGGESEGEEDAPALELPELEGTKTSELFAAVTSELDETNGDLIITCKGFNTALASKLAPLLQPMLESMGLVEGGVLDENGFLQSDPASALAEVVGMLNDLTQDNFQMTFTFAKDGTLRSTTIDVTLATEQNDGMDTYRTDIQIKGTFSIVEGGQKVETPSDADSYTEMDWRTVFDQETADMLGLVPVNGCVTLSDDPAVRERQILYIYNHYYDEFASILISGAGYVVDTYVVDADTATHPSHIGSLEGMISLRNPAAEEEDYTTVMSFRIPLESKGEGYPSEGSYIQFTQAKLEVVEDSEWGSYMYLCIVDYTK